MSTQVTKPDFLSPEASASGEFSTPDVCIPLLLPGFAPEFRYKILRFVLKPINETTELFDFEQLFPSVEIQPQLVF